MSTNIDTSTSALEALARLVEAAEDGIDMAESEFNYRGGGDREQIQQDAATVRAALAGCATPEDEACPGYVRCGCSSCSDGHCMYCLMPEASHTPKA